MFPARELANALLSKQKCANFHSNGWMDGWLRRMPVRFFFMDISSLLIIPEMMHFHTQIIDPIYISFSTG